MSKPAEKPVNRYRVIFKSRVFKMCTIAIEGTTRRKFQYLLKFLKPESAVNHLYPPGA